MRFTKEILRPIIAIRDALKLILDFQQLDDAFSMRDVRIRKQPKPDFAAVDVLKQFSQSGVWLDDVF